MRKNAEILATLGEVEVDETGKTLFEVLLDIRTLLIQSRIAERATKK